MFFFGTFELISRNLFIHKYKIITFYSALFEVFKKCANLGTSFALFSFFSNKIKTCRLQWDSNSDRRSRGQACRPFGHHHHKTYFNYLKYYKFEYTIATYAVSCTALFLLHGYSYILVSFLDPGSATYEWCQSIWSSD